MPKLPFSPRPKPDSLKDIHLAILKEHLRQARLTFDLSVVAVILSLGISIAGTFFLMNSRVSEGAFTAASGLFSTSFCTQIAKDAKEKLKQITEKLETNRNNGG